MKMHGEIVRILFNIILPYVIVFRALLASGFPTKIMTQYSCTCRPLFDIVAIMYGYK
jgi:hypothetical protein